jgi:hypothetical protein
MSLGPNAMLSGPVQNQVSIDTDMKVEEPYGEFLPMWDLML